jgi:translation initiation factor 2 beta subunit (eIF-2beta)/eIF-5
MMFGIDKGKFMGQWLKIDKKTSESLGSGTEQSELSKNKQEKIKKELEDLFKKKKIYSAKEMPDEKVEKRRAYHYVLSLDREKIKEIIPELFSIAKESSEGSSNNTLGKLGTADIEKLTQSIGQFLDKINGLDVDVWIGKRDYLLYRAKADKEIEASALKEGANGKLAINFDLKLSKFGEPIKIEAPKNFLDLSDIQSFLDSNPYINEARDKARNAAIRSYLSNLRIAAELYAMNNKELYIGFCASSDAIKDAKRIAENGKIMICNDSSIAWAACSPIYDKTERNWCVDSNGFLKAEPDMICNAAGFIATVCP